LRQITPHNVLITIILYVFAKSLVLEGGGILIYPLIEQAGCLDFFADMFAISRYTDGSTPKTEMYADGCGNPFFAQLDNGCIIAEPRKGE
jgi:hypothetical protein